VFKITFASELKQDGEDLKLTRAMLKDYNISIEDGNHFTERKTRPLPVWHWIDHVGPQSSKASLFLLEDMGNENYVHLHMYVRYQLEVCMSHGYLSEFTMTREFVEKLSNMKTNEAQRLLEHVATEKKKYFDPMEIFGLKAPKGTADTKIPDYCCFMRTARVTPSTIYYNTPSVDASNRIVRKYSEVADHFLRVRFMDEKTEGRINSSMNDNNDEVFTNVKRTLSNGITIGDRHYEFLAFGNSQFREHGAYFFAKGGPISAASIRAWMGQFNHIRNVAKYAARLGQCFSTTRAFSSTNVEVALCDDIVRNGYTFSDGVGKISKFLAQMAKTELNIKTPTRHLPSAFQFRLGGSKGMLVLSPDPRPREVHIRPSQYKFHAEHSGLEIIRWSQFSFATLNRQIIIVLSALGIPDRAFLSKLDYMLSSFNDAMKDDQKAIDLLQKWIDPNQMTLTIAQMVGDGFRQADEPYVCTLLELWRAWHLKYLKEKAKITVEKGANLLGCLDETGVLKGHFEDKIPKDNAPLEQRLAALPEIFVQICRCEKQEASKDAKYEVIEGVCILARNPSLHPGDIRVVRAVNRPQLQEYRDVVVFPQTGDRDIASMCSGGDLDGDDYLVIWDPDLIPAQWFTQPMNYTSRKAPDLPHDVTVDAITSFFVIYMKNDCLPTIAHAHLALADWLPKGVMEKKCLRLAQLHSDAVDFNKTGAVAVMTKDLRPNKWPHFMEKRHVPQSRIYKSKRVLGQLYDAVQVPAFLPNLENSFDTRILNSPLLEASEEYMVYVKELKEEYDMAMRQIMAQYEIGTEFEIVSGFTLRHCFPGKDYKMQEDMGRISSLLRGGFRRQCYDKVGNRDGNIAALVLAMYRVTHQEMTAAFEAQRQEETLRKDLSNLDVPSTKLPLISFPWIFPEVLGKIATSRVGERAGPEEGAAGGLPVNFGGNLMFTYKEAQKASEAMNDQRGPEMMEPVDNAPDAQLPSPTGSWEPLMEFPGEGIASFEDPNSEPSFDEATIASLRQCRLGNGNENRVRESTGSMGSMGSWCELVERRDELSMKDEESGEGVCKKKPVEIDMIEDAGMKGSFKPDPLGELLNMLG
jgi:RNA-dependent RNA polymerase